jgi:zinc and cadmium transporter
MLTPVQLLICYSILIVAASLLGGYAPRWIKLTHSRMQTALSFVSGVLLGIGVLHLIPHAFFALESIDQTMLLTLAGFLVTFFMQRVFHFHTHEVYDPNERPAPSPALPVIQLNEQENPYSAPQHEHGLHCDHGHDHQLPSGRWTWIGVFFGLTMHTVIDGLALGAAVNAESGEGHDAMFAGLGFFLAVVLHKPFDSLSIASLMHMSGWSARAIALVNFGYALIAPLGIALFYLGMSQSGSESNLWLGGTMAFAAGACICIAASDLLPELQFHSHDRIKLSVALLLGLGLAWGLVFIEESGHDHSHKGHKHSHAGHKH